MPLTSFILSMGAASKKKLGNTGLADQKVIFFMNLTKIIFISVFCYLVDHRDVKEGSSYEHYSNHDNNGSVKKNLRLLIKFWNYLV